jgi:hypothetical protein
VTFSGGEEIDIYTSLFAINNGFGEYWSVLLYSNELEGGLFLRPSFRLAFCKHACNVFALPQLATFNLSGIKMIT